jgi:hypothetical protein
MMRPAEKVRLADSAVMNCARFRCVRRGAIVPFVRARCSLRARLSAAILSFGLVFSFACSATCANCLSSSAATATESHECGHAGDGGTGAAQHQTPSRPDCSRHLHAGFEAVQGDALSPIQLSATRGASQLSTGAASSELLKMSLSFLSDLAPPQDAMISLQRNVSILRI